MAELRTSAQWRRDMRQVKPSEKDCPAKVVAAWGSSKKGSASHQNASAHVSSASSSSSSSSSLLSSSQLETGGCENDESAAQASDARAAALEEGTLATGGATMRLYGSVRADPTLTLTNPLRSCACRPYLNPNQHSPQWQTAPWHPPALGANGAVPKNAFGNYELWDGDTRLLPAGCVWVRLPKVAVVAKSLGLDFAPAVTGFGRRGSGAMARAVPEVMVARQ